MMYQPILSLKPKLGFLRTRVSCITLVAALALSSFGSAAQKSGKVWWPQFRGPNSSGLGEGRPPVHFGPDQNVLWKTAVGAGLSSPIVWEDRVFLTEVDQPNKQLSTLCIDRRTGKILWRRTVTPEQIEKVHELSSPAGATPATDGESVYVYFGSYGLVSYDLNGNLKWERRLPLPENPYARFLHQSSRANCWCSTIKGKTPTCSASIAVTAERSGRRTVRCFSTDGRLLCIGGTTGSTRLLCSEATLSRTNV